MSGWRSLRLRDSRPLLSRGRAVARAGAVALASLVALAGGTLTPAPAVAQEGQPSRAGLVVDFGNGTVITRCVDLGPSGQATGEQLLRAAGLSLTAEYSAMGAAICSIEGVGCNYPMQPCWCQCTSSPCVYWIYYYLANGQWVYSNLGASSRIVRAGDVDGWVWGAGTSNQGALPPVRTFAEICAAPTPTPTPTATATPTPLPTDTPTPSPTATWTPTATGTATPAAGLSPAPPTATPVPSPTAIASPAAPTATPTATPTTTPPSLGTPGGPLPPPAPEPPAAMEVPAAPDNGAGRRAFLPLLEHGRVAVSSATAADVLGWQPSAMSTSTPVLAPVAAPSPARVALANLRQPLSREEVAAALAARAPRNAVPTGGGGAQAWSPSAAAVTRATWDPLFATAMAAAFSLGLAAARRVHRRSASLDDRRLAAAAGPRARPGQEHRRLPLSSGVIYGLCLALGLIALLYPFLQATSPASPSMGQARAADAPLLMAVLVGLIFLVMLAEVQEQAVSAKTMALLGVLVAINSALRFIEVAIPGPGGFTPIWVLIVLAGYVYGPRFGFLMGALTLAVSAVITGGVGPWLPAQMFTAGWMGLSAPLARPLVRAMGGEGSPRREVWALAAFAGLWGLIYGVIINLWFWPFMAGPPDQYYQAGLALGEVVRRYATFYALTSLVWDSMAVAGNVALTLAFGASVLSALRRFQQRFEFQYRPWTAQATP
ncbi:MAG: ECF transporter S component [Caldilineales bacterium]|nr:ECF transporter S component [Caldilineales bacterium]